MIRRPPRSTQGVSSAASDVYKRQVSTQSTWDVFTTGSTVEECCKVLKKAEPKKIIVLTMGRAQQIYDCIYFRRESCLFNRKGSEVYCRKKHGSTSTNCY
eukprot:TRINITY_DN17250_c0_g1_i3.p4 TRINITY_DN17250_c0_g1~~TRINITY_DN17250_c0_g1_i3.p4  ORF type:complete len:100 (+),score=17.72 TRINITY_DN17250_c0_g1_i3:104-403(+)